MGEEIVYSRQSLIPINAFNNLKYSISHMKTIYYIAVFITEKILNHKDL